MFTAPNATQPFTAYWATSVGDGGLDFVSFDMSHSWSSPFEYGLRSVRQARYVLLVADPSDAGYSLRELEVYPCPPDRP